MTPTIWQNCYDEQWGDLITKGAYTHPAKFSRGLIDRIYKHMLAKGWIKKGDKIGDPFGGVGTGGIIAAYNGQAWCGVELEPRFVTLAELNFAMHRETWQRMKLPHPVIFRGDSRKFDEHVKAVVTSPPYANSTQGNEHCGIDWEKAKRSGPGGGEHQKPGASVSTDYGRSDGQIGAMPEGSIDATITSPPFAATSGTGGGGINVNGYKPAPGRKWTGDKLDPVGKRTYQGQGGDRIDGNIEVLKEGSVESVVTSPPWCDNTEGVMKSSKFKDPVAFAEQARKTGHGASLNAKIKAMAADECRDTYGDSPGQIGKLKGGEVDAAVTSPPYADIAAGAGGLNSIPPNTNDGEKENYWQAVHKVYRAVWRSLKEGGYLCVVVKSYVKKGKIVDLPADTLRLLLHIGFEHVETVHAMLVKETSHPGLFEESVKITKSRKSFFRRNAEKKGSPPIDWECVLFVRKPISPLHG